jgi:uncharacterized coiled-coil protein SlyX
VSSHTQQGQGVDPQAVIDHLGRQIGALSAQLAMRDVALEERDARIAQLEEQLDDVPSSVRADAPTLPPPAGKDQLPSDDLPTSHIPMPPAKANGPK